MSEQTRAVTVDVSDRRLLEVDIEGSIAHVRMLGAAGIIPTGDAETMSEALTRILEEASSGSFIFEGTDEDVHTAVERRLGELVGDISGRLHTGRSRNDQVSLDLRLYLRRAGDDRCDQIAALIGTLMRLAEEHAARLIPTYTHGQQAQSTTLGDHLLAYAWMLLRDRERTIGCVARLAESPLGAGASAGSSLPIDRAATATELGFHRVMSNTLDAVGSRDFVAEYVFACAQTMANLSRLAEELVLWSTKEFGWVTLGDDVSTGSSALPHKRNPDIAELVRGRAAVVAGDVTAILSLQKGLPLTYNRDLQEDKRIVFHADDTLSAALAGMTAMLTGITFHPPAPSAEVASLDLADALVERGVAFREAHRVVGEVVKVLEASGRGLDGVTDADLAGVDGRFIPGDAGLVDPATSVRRRGVEGRVRAQITELRDLLATPAAS